MPTILLILTIMMPPDKPDGVMRMPEASIEKCWEDAAAFFAQGIPRGYPDAVGLKAACAASAEALKPDEHS